MGRPKGPNQALAMKRNAGIGPQNITGRRLSPVAF